MGVTSSPPTFFKEAIGWSIGLSILMILAGLLAIALPQVAGIAVNILVAWLLVFSGAVHLAFGWSRRSTGGFLWELLVGVLYIFVGGYLLLQPLTGLASLTLAFAIYLVAKAALEFVLYFRLRPARGSGWVLLNACASLILGLMIGTTWPSSSEWVIGFLVGVSMLFSGMSRLAISLAARHVVAHLA